MKALTQKMSRMEELMGGQSMGYSFDFTDILCTEENKLLDNFEVPQLPKFNGAGDPRIHLSQYLTVMSIAKAPLSIVTKLFVSSLEGTVVNWYYSLEKSIQANWSELSTAFLKHYESVTKLRTFVGDLELAKQRRNKSLLDFLTRFMNNTDLIKDELIEEDEVGMIIWDILPNLVKRLQRMNPKTFTNLYNGL